MKRCWRSKLGKVCASQPCSEERAGEGMHTMSSLNLDIIVDDIEGRVVGLIILCMVIITHLPVVSSCR